MALTIDLIRHAESEMNVAMANAKVPFIGGRQNEIDLSSLGETQALDLGRFALSSGIVPTEFYSSPAVRTMRTHEISSRVLGLAVVAMLDDRLQELDQGEWTNKPRALYDDPMIKREMSTLGSAFAPPAGESMDTVNSRARAFLDSLATSPVHDSRRHIWVHTHGVVIKTLVGNLLGWTHEQTYKTPIDNASITRITYDDVWQVEAINQPTSGQSIRS